MRGKFLYLGDEKLYLRGVTFGPFAANRAGEPYPDREAAERDLARMASSGINAIRTYTVPPRWLLDIAARHGLWVMVGLAWEQHIAFLSDRRRRRSIERRVREDVRACAGHPAIACYAVGNEIPAPIVRWHGRRRIERFLARLCAAVRSEDPHALVTYVNYPSTEYLRLPFADLLCFNVYLESDERLRAYAARLQNLAGDRPLVISELGLDSRRNGEHAQAHSLARQVTTLFDGGCAGLFVFAWSDAWHRGGEDVDDWDFGLVDRARRSKPALRAVSDAYASVPLAMRRRWPAVSVVVCTHNGAATLRWCLDSLMRLDYPDYEVIVVDDGSTDGSAEIAGGFDVRVIRSAHGGLSRARNTGLWVARGEIVAYIDDDAAADPHWLAYLATTFASTDHVGVGGPNIPPPDGIVAECVANAPGGPRHVLLSDTVAEHIPGCNMAFRREALEAIGGFDERFVAAGDDVDLCWRLQATGSTIGFSPAAVVWHRRRASALAYARQQRGYGVAEALLERNWPERYNRAGQARWAGRVYADGRPSRHGRRSRICYGTWGSNLFQSIYERRPGAFASLLDSPEWHIVLAALAALVAAGFASGQIGSGGGWVAPALAAMLLALVCATIVAPAVLAASALPRLDRLSRRARLARRSLTALLHLLQPPARLCGRLQGGLTPWRLRGPLGLTLPRRHARAVWCRRWQALPQHILEIETNLRASGVRVMRGGSFDRWDLEVRVGALGAARVLCAVEEHGQHAQLLRVLVYPLLSRGGLAVALALAGVTALARLAGAVPEAASLAGATAMLAVGLAAGCAVAVAAGLRAVSSLDGDLLEQDGSLSRPRPAEVPE